MSEYKKMNRLKVFMISMSRVTKAFSKMKGERFEYAEEQFKEMYYNIVAIYNILDIRDNECNKILLNHVSNFVDLFLDSTYELDLTSSFDSDLDMIITVEKFNRDLDNVFAHPIRRSDYD